MNDYKDVYDLDLDQRKYTNLEMCRRYIVKGDNPVSAFKDTGIKDAFKGKGTIEAIANVRKDFNGEDKFVVFTKQDNEFYFYEYSEEFGVRGKRGPYVDMNTAMSNADCSGLFEESNDVSAYDVLNEELDYDVEDLNEKLF